jgi:aryl-alcohol dehydrogenase-like predicted oxidoreductase
MKRRSFGKSGLQVTPIGLGLAALGRPGYINLGHAKDLEQDYQVASMEAHAHEVLDAAWELGIRYFDAARSYGKAEEFLASWLIKKDISPAEVTVGSKWGYTYTAGWQVEAEKHEVKEHTLPVLRRQTAESLELLGSYLDLYQIHSATLESGVLEREDVLEELARLRDEGLVIGLTVSGPRQTDTIRRAMEIRDDNRPIFASVQATWNLLEVSTGPALRDASEAGLGVIVKEALANGRLTPRNDEPGFQKRRELLNRIAADYETTIDALALAAVLKQTWADVVLSGAATVDHVRSNIQALDINLTHDTLEELQSISENPADYWSTRDQLAWN